jgi:hypothetical protein
MLSTALIIVSLILGYVVVAALTMVSTFAIASLNSSFVVDGHRLRTRYKLLQDALWTLSSGIGGYLALLAAREASLALTAILLAAVLLFVLWKNSEETRQIGLLHMLLMSACIVAGIAVAYIIRVLQIAE